MGYDLEAIGRGLRLFRAIYDPEESWSEGRAVWARDAAQAERVATRYWRGEEDSPVGIVPVKTTHRPRPGLCWPHVSGLMEDERAAELVLEGEGSCTSCSLGDLSDGEVDEWRQCRDCGSCASCGHAPDCSEYFPLARVN